MTATDTLAPCPFCGGEAALRTVRLPMLADCDDICIYCTDCDVDGPHILFDQTEQNADDIPDCEARACVAWNTRTAAPADVAGLVERLGQLHDAARGREMDLVPTDGPIAQLALFMHENGDHLCTTLTTQAARIAELEARVDRMREALVMLQNYAERTEATFKERLGDRKSPTWFAVNALQDFAGFVRMWSECHDARASLDQDPPQP